MHELKPDLVAALEADDLTAAAAHLAGAAPQEVAAALATLEPESSAVAFRLLPKGRALAVFEGLTPPAQHELIHLLGEEEVVGVFAALDPDDRVELLDELPAGVATRLLRHVDDDARAATAVVLGYPRGSVGRRMSPQFVQVHPEDTLQHALERVRERGRRSETIYTVPVVDDSRCLVGVVSLRDLFLHDPSDTVADHLARPMAAHAEEDAEQAARRCLARGVLALPVVDGEGRLVGLLTVDDATRIVAAAGDEDAARAGGAEPLARPYLLSSVGAITRARVVWLLVLGLSAVLTVNVLELFEGTLAEHVVLALFIPLLTGIGGNTGSQAATTVTRALATGEAAPRDIGRVAFKELRTGLLLGAVLGSLGWAVASLVYGPGIGTVVGLTLVAVCTMAATVGGTTPLVARAAGVDPAVVSTPFITTFCDATGLVIYFTIAHAVLGL
ncbi:magnesium transporter [Georgenia satyanarayanai]|uniref:magnesium transporter n=1 Tax=Georgenia satyanarayanai TaxID=860221 RepID=UPI002040B0B2|nr:magnesium transporter [Georgenia satyanarayanai]MCM3659953.1 magnesium transporter [Georgenia satyanarayanai]